MELFELIDAFRDYKIHNQGRSIATIDKYTGSINRFFESTKKPYYSVTEDDLRIYVGKELHTLGLSSRSRRTVVAAMRAFFGFIYERGVIKSNPAHRLEYPNSGYKLPIPATLDTAETLILSIDITSFTGLRDCTMIYLLIATGIRVSGLVNLNHSSLQWISHKNKEHLVIKVKEKGKKERLVPVHTNAALMLRAYLASPELEQIDDSLPSGDRVLFVSVKNSTIYGGDYTGEKRRITRRSVHNIIKKHGLDAGLPSEQLKPHALRHLFGTQMAESDISLSTLQSIMGHSSFDTTKIYLQLAMGKAIEDVDKGSPIGKIHTHVSDIARAL